MISLKSLSGFWGPFLSKGTALKTYILKEITFIGMIKARKLPQ